MNKASKFLFYIFLISIPFQTRVFLWSAGIVEGFNEWQSVFLYGTDILVLLLFISWFFDDAKNKEKNKENLSQKILVLMLLFIGSALFSVFIAYNTEISVYRFIKLIEFVGIFFYSAYMFKKVEPRHIYLAFVYGALVQSVIAIGQFFLQKSIGLYLLGEPYLEAGRLEVAEFVSFGSRFMRAYGTFPSPNVLAAYLAIGILFLAAWAIAGDMTKNKKERFFAWQAGILMSFALLLTFSRAAIASFAVVAIFYAASFSLKKLKRYKKNFLIFIIPFIATSFFMTILFWPEIYSRIFTTFNYNDLALRERFFFNELGTQLLESQKYGVGIGNYTLYMRGHFSGLRDALYQPVHNIFLLTAVELGYLGLSLFLLLLGVLFFMTVRKFIRGPDPMGLLALSLFSFIILSGLWDHFYLTIQQGSLMLWFILGLVYYYVREYKVVLKEDY